MLDASQLALRTLPTATGRGIGRARHGTASSLPTMHNSVCTPCDAARQVVEALAVELDPLDNWPDVEAEGMTVQDRLTAIVAGVLHCQLGVYTDPNPAPATPFTPADTAGTAHRKRGRVT